MVATFEQLRTKKPKTFDELRAKPDFGMIALPREKLPGVWDYDKQLEALLGDPEKPIEDFVPLDVRYDFGRIVGMTEKPDETTGKMKLSLLYKSLADISPRVSFDLMGELNKIMFNKPIDVNKAMKEYSDYYTGAKKYTTAIKHGLKNLGVRLVQVPVGMAKMEAEIGGKIRKKFWEIIRKEQPEYQKKIDETLARWSDEMYAAIGEYYRENKAELVQIVPGTGFRGTLFQYAHNPQAFVQSLTESMGIILEGLAGTMLGGPGGGIIAMGLPLSFEVYPDVRAEGTEPLPALAQSMMTGMGEATIEQWTLSRKLGLMKNYRKYVAEGLPKMLWEGIKVYFRGTAEEGTQEFNRNFWRWVFTDRSQQWKENLAESMAIGGPMELAMAGGFSAVGAAVGPAIPKDQQIERIDQIQEAVEKSPLTEEHKAEIQKELDAVREDVEADVYKPEPVEAEKPVAPITKPEAVEVAPEVKQPWEMTKEEFEAAKGIRQTEEELLRGEIPITKHATHRTHVKRAVEDELPVPHEVLEEYKSEKWAQEALTKSEAVEVAPEAKPTEEVKKLNEIFIRDEIRQKNLIAGRKATTSIKGIKPSKEAEDAWNKLRNMGYKLKSPMMPTEGFNIEAQPPTVAEPTKVLEKLTEKAKTYKTADSFAKLIKLTKEEVQALKDAGFVKKETRGKLPDLRRFWLEAEPTKVKAPKELLGGVAKEPPGLTKAEVEHLGVREQDALRAAQARGLKVGYKKGVAETVTDARRSLDAFRMKEAISQKGKIDVANVVLTYVPKEKQGDYIRRILQAKTQKRIERLTEAIDKYLDKYEKRQAIRGFKKFVKDIKKKYRRGEVALGYLPKKLSDKIVDVLDKFDLAKISEKKEETLESRLKFVTRISGELAEGFEQLNADLDKGATDLLLMGTRRIEELKRLSQKYIGDLDVDEIKYIQASLEHLIKINDLKGKSKERLRIEALRTHINKALQEVSVPKKEVVELTGVLGAVKWLAVEGQSTIRTLVGLATGKDNASNSYLLIEELDKANIKRKETYKDFIMHFRKLATRKGIEWSDIKDLNKFTKITIGGKVIEIDYDNLLSIYAHTQAEGNLRRLLNTRGLNIITYKRDEHGIFTKKHTYRLKKPTLAELRAISEIIPEKHKKILDVYFKSNWEKQAPAINETSMAYQNYELARQEKYYHVSREIERVTEGRKADLSISLDQQSRALPRTGGNARINIKPFSHEVMDNMQWSAAYHAMTIPMENARTLVANIKWREAMKKAGQEKKLREIVTMLRRTQGLIADQSVVELTASKLLGTVGKSILSLRFSGSLVQTASVPAAVEFIDKKYLSQVDVPMPSDIKHLKEISPVLWMRWEAKQFDYALGIVGAQNAFETLLFDHRAITDKFLFPYTAGDEIAIVKLFMAAERQIETETKLKRGTDEFQQASLDLLYEAMTTQPQWDMIHRSPLTSDPSVLARSISMFMSARNAQYNVLIRSLDNYRKGRITKAQLSERLAGVGTANLLVSVARHTFKAVVKAAAITALVAMGIRKSPDDEEIKKEVERLAKKIPLETVFNLIGLNALGTLFTSMGYAALKTRKYGWRMGRYSDIRTGNMLADLTLDFMQMGIDFTLFTDQLISGEKYKSGKNRGRYKWEITGKRLIDDITLLIAYRYGLPYEGIKSDIVWPVQSALKESETPARKGIKRSE